MDKDTLWLDLFRGREINQEFFSDVFSPNGPEPTDEYIHYIDDEETGITIRVYAFIVDNRVSHVDVHKSMDSGMGHFRTVSDERKLTLAEKKKVRSIYDACFPDQARNEIDTIINLAVERRAECKGFSIIRALKNGVSYLTPTGAKGILQRERILQALDYSHTNIRILRELGTVAEFSACYSKQPWEPLAAVLSVVDPTEYSEFEQLDKQYRKDKLEEAIECGSFAECIKYEDALNTSAQELTRYVSFAIQNKQKNLFDWLMSKAVHVEDCNLSQALYMAITKDDTYAIACILDSGKLVPEAADFRNDWHTPMYVARAKENLELQKRLVRLGYPGEIDEALLETEELKELLSYPLKIFVSTWERAKAEKRDDILEIIVNRMLHDHQSNWIMIRYAEDKNWDAFIHGLSNGYDANGHALFEACWENGTEWTDKLLENGFDINQDAGKILNRAVQHRNLSFTKYLVEHGADVMATESYSATVLEKSLGSEGHWGNKGPANEELSVYLLEQGADPFRCLRSLFYRGGRIRQKTIDIIIDSGKINCVDSEGHLPLYYVVSNFNPPDDGTVEYLLSKGACADASGICDDLLFCYAFENYYKYPHVWKALIAAGANVNESLALCSPLRRALMWKAPVQYFEELLDAGANVNELLQPIIRMSDSTYWSKPKPLPKTPLDVAESEGLDEIAALFRRHGALTYAEIVQGRA